MQRAAAARPAVTPRRLVQSHAATVFCDSGVPAASLVARRRTRDGAARDADRSWTASRSTALNRLCVRGRGLTITTLGFADNAVKLRRHKIGRLIGWPCDFCTGCSNRQTTTQ